MECSDRKTWKQKMLRKRINLNILCTQKYQPCTQRCFFGHESWTVFKRLKKLSLQLVPRHLRPWEAFGMERFFWDEEKLQQPLCEGKDVIKIRLESHNRTRIRIHLKIVPIRVRAIARICDRDGQRWIVQEKRDRLGEKTAIAKIAIKVYQERAWLRVRHVDRDEPWDISYRAWTNKRKRDKTVHKKARPLVVETSYCKECFCVPAQVLLGPGYREAKAEPLASG